jgi:hypothetical protein
MRAIASILALLILILSCIPCADGGTGMERHVTQSVCADTAPQHTPHEHQDLCSPFCACSCCAAFSLVIPPFALPARIEAPALPVYTSYTARPPVARALPVWQPPQLA